jgi:hypothetical protein
MVNLKLVAVEALTVLYATKFSRNLSLLKILLEGDALQVMNAVTSRGRNWSKYTKLLTT